MIIITMPLRARNRGADVTEISMEHRYPEHSPDAPQHGHAAAQVRRARFAATEHAHASHEHAGMVAEYRLRFWISLALTAPILLLSPAAGHGLELIGALTFPGARFLLLALSSAVYFYGGWPFLTGLIAELGQRQPGMMTLISLAISVVYFYRPRSSSGSAATCSSGRWRLSSTSCCSGTGSR
jgi:P-type Cu2+ transporter